MSVRSKKRLFFFVLWASLVLATALVPRPAGGQQSTSKSKPASPGTARRVKAIFTERCFQCHGLNGKAAKNIFALDRARLVFSRVVIPGDAASPLLKAVESGAMPADGPELSAEDKAAVREWILAGAPDWDEDNADHRAFISESSMLTTIAEDLERTALRDRPYVRYLSIAHLRNAGTPEEELESHRLAISKLVNSLSWRLEIAPPAPIDAARTLFRIDLRDYLWTEAIWRRVLTDYPYTLILPESERIARLSGEIAAYVRGDWFVAAASAPPLYHELLGLPHSIAELERRLGVDTARQLVEEKHVVRAGVRSSGVSQNNRALERHVSPFGAYWRSYDFQSNLGDQNIFANPLRLNAAGGAIKRDVWEKHFGDVARELQLGIHLPGQQLAAKRHSIRADALIFSNPTRQRVVQAAPAHRAFAGGSIESESNDLLRSARTVLVRSSTVYLRPESLENALRARTEFQSLDIAIVKDRQTADLVIDLNRPLFTFDFTYSVWRRQSSKLIGSGKVTAFDGNGAAPKIAKELIKQIQSARSQR